MADTTPERSKIIIPGDDNPQSLLKLMENLVRQQRVVTLITRRGERFVVKLVEVRKELVIGEVRVLNWSPDMARKIYKDVEDKTSGEGLRAMLLADAIDNYGKDAHRYRVFIVLEDIVCCYVDQDDQFDETPFLPLP